MAGGFRSKGAVIGTVYVSADSVRYCDRRVSITEPNYRDYAIGYYPVVDARRLARELRLPTGIVVTGGSFENSPTDEAMIRQHDAVAVEMEAAAVAKVSMLMKTPFMAVKAIVNLVEKGSETFADQFAANFDRATAGLTESLVAILDYCAGRTIDEL